MSGADMSGANLYNANMNSAWMSNANLWGANLLFASLYETNLSGAIFSYTENWNTASWSAAFYYIDNEPSWASGMTQAWRDSAGILALAPVPEPTTLLLALIGLSLLPLWRRR